MMIQPKVIYKKFTVLVNIFGYKGVSLMEDVKEQGKEWVRKVVGKTQKWLSRLFDETDLKLSRARHFLSATKEEFQRYIEDRNILVNQIEMKEKEINNLREKMLKVERVNPDKYAKLYNKLESKTDELFSYRQQLQSMELQVETYRTEVIKIDEMKGQVIKERDILKANYDELNDKIGVYKEEKETLVKEIQELKYQQANDDEIKEKEKLLQQIEKAKEVTEVELQNEKTKLLEKLKEMAKLNSEFHDVKNKLSNTEQKLEENMTIIQDLQMDLVSIKDDARVLEKQLLKDQEDMDYYLNEHAKIEAELKKLVHEKDSMEEKMNHSLIDRQNEVDIMQQELENSQEDLAIAEAEKQELSKEDKEKRRILQVEYEPRFRELYHQSHFRSDFLDDFYALSASDRLKVEACIVNLNFNYELNRSKVRPSSVKVSPRLDEYPFADTGRIYFCKDKGVVQFYRLSRTKNGKGRLDQQKVIAWLKKKI